VVASSDIPPPEEWRLGLDIADRGESAAPRTAPKPPPAPHDLSAERLDRALYTLTVEHLAWFLIAIYAAATRLVALGERPMLSGEAAGALASFHIARDGITSIAAGSIVSWIDLARAALFAATGASDWGARIVSAACGLLLIASVFALRRRLGRAGALGLALILTLSPTLTWVSHESSGAAAAVAFALAAIALLLSCCERPGGLRAVAFGAAAGAAISAGPAGIIEGITASAALILIGIANAVVHRDAWFRMRVWWARRGSLAAVAAAGALVLWIPLALGAFGQPLPSAFAAIWRSLPAAGSATLAAGFAFYGPIIGLYEFAIVMLALTGFAAIALGRPRSYFAAWAALWALLSIAAFVALPLREHGFTAAIAVPLALVGAFGVDWLHRARAWRMIRYAVAAIFIAALWMQALTNAIVASPDPSEPAWSRRALLFWQHGAATARIRSACARAALSHAAGAAPKLYLALDVPEVEWYCRKSAIVRDAAAADIVVTAAGASLPQPSSAPAQVERVAYEEVWRPVHLTPAAAALYLATARAWSDVSIHDLEIHAVARPSQAPARVSPPHPIAPPVAALSTPKMLAATPTPTAHPTPAALPAAVPARTHPSTPARAATMPTVAAAPSPAAQPSPRIHHSVTPIASPSQSPTPAPSAVANPAPSAAPAPSPPPELPPEPSPRETPAPPPSPASPPDAQIHANR
jgi:predicted membrane-bound mannosyltransferase